MESEFLLNLKEISIHVIVISILVFTLTMLIKWPIKKATAKLEENKRKAVNTVIVFIPMLLSFVFSMLYFGLFENKWFDVAMYDTTASSYVLAVAIYAIFSRIVILIKGTKSSQITSEETELSKETISYIKQNIKSISSSLKIDQSNLEKTIIEIEKLLSVRDNIKNNLLFQDIAQAEKIETQLNELETKKQNLTKSISLKQTEIENYQKSLTK